MNEKGDEWLDSVEETSERHSTHKKKEERTEEEPRLSLGLYTYKIANPKVVPRDLTEGNCVVR